MGNVYGYARVSAAHQDLEIQIEDITKFTNMDILEVRNILDK
ncbi:hypothetical protein ACLBXI_25335 [Bacillus cereus]